MLRKKFAFRFIEVAEQAQRMGREGLEAALIGTLASCPTCVSSPEWLGKHSPKPQIRESGLWLVHHLTAGPLTSDQLAAISAAIE